METGPMARVCWRYVTTGSRGQGEWIAKADAEARLEQLNREYPKSEFPEIAHWLEVKAES